MSRIVTLSTVQPCGGDHKYPGKESHLESEKANARVVEEGFDLLEESLNKGADIVCLPELFNVFGLGPRKARVKATDSPDPIVNMIIGLAKKYNSYVILPILEHEQGDFYNSTLIVNGEGGIGGKYRKTHLTDNEKDAYGIVPGDSYPVFELDFGSIGIITCYDMDFPEVGRILTLKGAEVLFFPRWQSGPSEIIREMLPRVRAFDYSALIVSSSYGVEPNKAWKPGMFFGKSRIIDLDGTVLADAGHTVGAIHYSVDLEKNMLMDVLDEGGDVRDLKKLKLEDRRPKTYAQICQEDWE